MNQQELSQMIITQKLDMAITSKNDYLNEIKKLAKHIIETDDIPRIATDIKDMNRFYSELMFQCGIITGIKTAKNALNVGEYCSCKKPKSVTMPSRGIICELCDKHIKQNYTAKQIMYDFREDNGLRHN